MNKKLIIVATVFLVAISVYFTLSSAHHQAVEESLEELLELTEIAQVEVDYESMTTSLFTNSFSLKNVTIISNSRSARRSGVDELLINKITIDQDLSLSDDFDGYSKTVYPKRLSIELEGIHSDADIRQLSMLLQQDEDTADIISDVLEDELLVNINFTYDFRPKDDGSLSVSALISIDNLIGVELDLSVTDFPKRPSKLFVLGPGSMKKLAKVKLKNASFLIKDDATFITTLIQAAAESENIDLEDELEKFEDEIASGLEVIESQKTSRKDVKVISDFVESNVPKLIDFISDSEKLEIRVSPDRALSVLKIAERISKIENARDAKKGAKLTADLIEDLNIKLHTN